MKMLYNNSSIRFNSLQQILTWGATLHSPNVRISPRALVGNDPTVAKLPAFRQYSEELLQ